VNNKRSRGGRQNGPRRPSYAGGGGNSNAGGGGGGGGGGGNRNFDSNGPEVKIRGTASHIFDRYCQLARDANSSGDRIAAENYLQHAEHYYRIMLANGFAQQRQNGQQNGQPNGNGETPNEGQGDTQAVEGEAGREPEEASA